MPRILHHAVVVVLLSALFFLAGGAALRESVTVDEVTHIGSGLSYVQRLDLRLNPEHPPLGKVLAAIPLALRGTRADYSSPAWVLSGDFFSAFSAQWVFGDAVLGRWNDWKATLLWARFPMLTLTLLLAWFVYRYAGRLGGPQGGLLCLTACVSAPVFLAFGPLVITDVPVTLFTLIALWRLGEIWVAPSSGNALRFGLALGASLLSKFTGLLIIAVIIVLFVQARFWPPAEQSTNKDEYKAWRKARWRCAMRGILWAALCVYIAYFILSWNQSDEALDRVGSGSWAWLIRRPLMPVWLYLRGLLLMLFMGSRTTFLFGHTYPHGVPYYFPIVFVFKSTLGFLLLLLLAGAVGWVRRKHNFDVIPPAVRPHWRVLKVGFFVFLAACLLSRLDISVRHFMVPIVLLTLMLAPLPRMIDALPQRRLLQVGAVALALSCLVSSLLAYPYFIPFVNSLAFGAPVYWLVNDSNVSWNESLPEVERFARQQGLTEIALDGAAVSDPTLVVPQARIWDCQAPTDRDAGQWVAVAAVSILENHNCGYLQQYPHRQLGGGSYYVFRFPTPLPVAGTPGGPPAPSERRFIWGLPFDIRGWTVNVERHPQQLQSELAALMRQFQQQRQAPAQPPNGK